MRPILLEMTAFGSYAKTTAVDFTRLSNDLYLITGDTGAGKTTIFDAILFALYGAASGTSRKPAMMHCDFVEKSVDTAVVLTFLQGGKKYTVKRTIHFSKIRGKTDQFGDPKFDATLLELSDPNKNPIEGATKVTGRCTELLELSEDQFRKIVMLAQGEFKEFLSADGKKKGEILGKLFDNSPYLHFQELLDGARKKLRKEREWHRGQIDNAMSVFQPPEGLDEAQLALYRPEAPELSRRLAELVEADTAALKETFKRQEERHRLEGVLQEEKGAAEGRNRLLDELAREKEKLGGLQQRREEMDRLGRQAGTVEKVLRQIRPRQEALERAKSAFRQVLEEIETLSQTLTGQEHAVKLAQASVDADSGVQKEIEALTAGIRALNEKLPKYGELAQKQNAAKEAAGSIKLLKKQKEALEKQRDAQTDALLKISGELKALENIDAQAVTLENAYEEAKKLSAAVTDIQDRVDAVLQKEEKLEQERETLKELTVAAKEAGQRWHGLYQRFLAGQAGLLAERLRQELSETGSAECPVCRSRFCAGQEHDFAALPEETPTKAAVDAAKNAFDAEEQRRSEQDRIVSSLETSIADEKDRILGDIAPLLSSCEAWEALCRDGYLPQELGRLQSAENDSKTAWESAVIKQKRSAELKTQETEKKALLENRNSEISKTEEALKSAQVSAAALEAELGALQNELDFPSQTAAQAEIGKKTAQRDKLQKAVDKNKKALEAAKETRDLTRGSLNDKTNSRPKLEQAVGDAEQALHTAFTQNGFSAPEEVRQALLPLNGRDGETWLTENRAALERYKSDCEKTQERIDALTKQTEVFSYTDLNALETQLDKAREAYHDALNAYNALNKLAENHRSAAQQVARAARALASSEGAWSRLDKLAGLAVGVNGEGGVMSFDRYVMGTVFREVLEMANARLNVMSGGQYELVHQLSAGRQNAKAGLDVEVLDMATGKRRSADSLSGGESFLVSLSLALGLSDVVQQHAGGRKLDTLFIDEGFGSLDPGTLDLAMNVLSRLTQGNCLVGIISHVGRLEESIPQKIRVKRTASGSSLAFE